MNDPHNEESEAPQPLFQLGLVWGFLAFHRRFFLGVLLAAAVGYFLFTKATEDSARSTSNTGQPTDEYLPQPAPVDSPELTTDDQGTTTEIQPKKEKSTVELIEHLISTNNDWQRLDLSGADFELRQRQKTLELLLSRDLADNQRQFCLVSYIDSFGYLSTINRRAGFDLEQIGAKVTEIDNSYSNHPSPSVAAKANLVFLRSTADRFISNELGIDQVRQTIIDRRAKICATNTGASNFAGVLVTMKRFAQESDDVQNLLDENLAYVATVNLSVAQGMASDLYLEKIDLRNLASRVHSGVSDSGREVEILFGGIERFPDMSELTYSAAASSIFAYQKIGKFEQAKQLLNRLRNAAQRISDEKLRQKVAAAIETLDPPTE